VRRQARGRDDCNAEYAEYAENEERRLIIVPSPASLCGLRALCGEYSFLSPSLSILSVVNPFPEKRYGVMNRIAMGKVARLSAVV
jgi:hypothetical protein